MSIASFMFFPILFLYLAVPTALLSILQYFLSRLESPWPGRVLPILSVVSSLCWTLVVLFNIVGPASPVLFPQKIYRAPGHGPEGPSRPVTPLLPCNSGSAIL